jgi:hypothetical protein
MKDIIGFKEQEIMKKDQAAIKMMEEVLQCIQPLKIR